MPISRGWWRALRDRHRPGPSAHPAAGARDRVGDCRGDKSLLLRGAQLAEAEQWLAGQTDQKPTTTPVQGQFIAASRRAATSRQRGSIVGAVVSCSSWP